MLRRRKPLRANPQTTRDWQDRSRKPIARSRGTTHKAEASPTTSREKRKDREKQETKLIVLERSRGVCEVRITGVCYVTATNYHHRKRESQGGRWEPENVIHMCGSGTTGCHGWIHSHVQQAQQLGYLVKGRQNPAKIPWSRYEHM